MEWLSAFGAFPLQQEAERGFRRKRPASVPGKLDLLVDSDILQRCQEAIGYEFSDPELLSLALTHASIAPSRDQSNERLEFLGDAVLGLVACHALFEHSSEMLEGDMTRIKSSVVSRQTCARIARNLGVCEFIALGKGMGNGKGMPMSVAAAALESLIGAVYVDGGFEPARDFVLDCIEPHIKQALDNQHALNYKSKLQQTSQRRWGITPQYLMLDEKGPDHAKCFEIAVAINGRHFPSAWGNCKKEAEQKAAMAALEELDLLGPEDLDQPGD